MKQYYECIKVINGTSCILCCDVKLKKSAGCLSDSKFCLKINQNCGVRFFKRDIYDGVLYFFYRSTCVCVCRGGGRAGERTTSFVEGVYLINLSCPGVVSYYFRQETYNLTIHGITFSTRSSVLMIMHYYSCNRTQYVIG